MTLRSIFLICLCLSVPLPVRAVAPHLPIDHWGYGFLERLETLGALEQTYFRTAPLSREDIARALLSVDTRLRDGLFHFSPVDATLFQKLKGEMADEIELLGGSVLPEERERHLWSFSEGPAKFHLDVQFQEDALLEAWSNLPDTLNRSRTTIGGRVRGRLAKNLTFYADFHNTLIKGEDIPQRNYDASTGLPISGSGGNRFTDQTSGYFEYQLPWVQALAGRDILQWGPAYTDGLTVSANGDVFDQIRLTFSFSRLRYTSIIGWLHSSIDKKRLAAHRLDLRITPRLNIAVMETVVYGGRGVQFRYANPLTVYQIVEKHEGDKDNNTLSFEGHWRPVDHLRLYTELFFDDYSLSEHPIDFYGNKWAATAGLAWTNPFGLRDSDVRAEYVRIEPWVYTHGIPVNTYTNYDRILGHPLGPNADLLLLEWSVQYSRALRLTAAFEHQRRGRGGVMTAHLPQDGEHKEFLDGVVESAATARLGLRWEPVRDVFCRLDYRHRPHDNYRRMEGLTTTGHQVTLALSIDY